MTRRDIEELRGSHWEFLHESVVLQFLVKLPERSMQLKYEWASSMVFFSGKVAKNLFHLHCETAIFITHNFVGHVSLVAPDSSKNVLLIDLFCVKKQQQPVLHFLHKKKEK